MSQTSPTTCPDSVHLNCGHRVSGSAITKHTGDTDFRPGTKTFCPICMGDEYVRNGDGTVYRVPDFGSNRAQQ